MRKLNECQAWKKLLRTYDEFVGLGLCIKIDYLYADGLISKITWYKMSATIEAEAKRRHRTTNAYMWSLSKSGQLARRRFIEKVLTEISTGKAKQ